MRRFLAFVVSAAILAAVYLQIDVANLVETLAGTDRLRLAASLLLLVALVLGSAGRLVLLAHAADLQVGARLAIKATFAANALNLILPGKLGDLAKASLMRDSETGSVLPGLRVCIYEKLSDLLAIIVCGVIALAVYPGGDWVLLLVLTAAAIGLLMSMTLKQVPQAFLRIVRLAPPGLQRLVAPILRSWIDLIARLVHRPRQLAAALMLTLVIWAGHFLQIAMMAWALGVTGPWLELVSLFPIIILAGLLPVTVAGIGPRDAAIVVLAGPLIGYPVAAALGVLFWLRYLVPGSIGLIFLSEFMKSLKPR